MMKHTGAGICDVFRYASLNPAKAANIKDAGRIAEGMIADLVFVDHMMNVDRVMIAGKLI
jgi:N-acetylglucosamine-6-phosphate deacetylase